jgi:hypothetical protein
MKTLLYGTTALVAAGMVVGGAQAADKIKVGVGGYFYGYVVGVDQDDGAGDAGADTRSHRITREGEIIFTGKTTLDNGIQFGVQVQLEAETCGDQIDESFMWASGSFGRINIGSENSAPYLMSYGAVAPSHWSMGLNSPGNRNYSTGGNSAATANTNQVSLTSDAEKVTYFTPRMSGFQLGVSYTPNSCEETDGADCAGTYAGPQNDTGADDQGEVVEIGANYVTKMGGASVGLSAGWGKGDNEAKSATGVDVEEMSLGGKISMNGYTVGARWYERETGTNTDTTAFQLGLRYKTGPWGVGIQYASNEVEVAAGGEDELTGVEIGGSYAMGPGVTMAFGMQFIELEDNLNAVGAENDATVVFIGTVLSF